MLPSMLLALHQTGTAQPPPILLSPSTVVDAQADSGTPVTYLPRLVLYRGLYPRADLGGLLCQHF